MKRAFTLVELLVVISIIGILASVIFVSNENAQRKGRDARRKADLNQIKAALTLYYQDNNGFPCFVPGGCGWASINLPGITNQLTPQYIKQIPTEPKGDIENYCYSVNYPGISPIATKSPYFTLYTVLENSADADAKAIKPTPVAPANTTTSDGNKTRVFPTPSCAGKIYNYWINNE